MLTPQMIEEIKKTEHISDLYEKRIQQLLRGRTENELIDDERAEFEILVSSSQYDPRKGDVGFFDKDVAIHAQDIGRKLATISNNDFMSDPYVVQWIAELGDAGRVCNLPLASDPDQRPYNVVKDLFFKEQNASVQSIVELVFSSQRALPAHFTSDEQTGRTQSFLISSSLIEEKDEYDMASSAHQDFFEFFSLTPQTFQDDPSAKVGLKVGEDLMIGSYLMIKTKPQANLKQLRHLIVEENIRMWDSFDARPYLEDRAIQCYLEYCTQYGKAVAEERSKTDLSSLFELYVYQAKQS